MIPGCHNCRIGPGALCASCKRVNQDDIRIRHAPHNRDAYTPAVTIRSPKSTPLPDEAEDKFRRFIYGLRDLTIMQWRLLYHVWHGGSPSTFGAMVTDVIKRTGLYGDRERRAEWEAAVGAIGPHVSRQTASLIWNRLCNKFEVFRHFQTWPTKARRQP